MSQMQTRVNCPNCGNQFSAPLHQIIDVGQNPTLKMQFLAGQINAIECPNCGNQLSIATPLAYHDPSKDLLIMFVPSELGLNHDEQEQLIGRLLRTIVDSLPQEERRGYLLNPKRTLTMQGMIDTILEADGITKEMLNERQEKLELVERFIRAENDEQLHALIEAYDTQLDEEFFSMLNVTIETSFANGRQDVAETITHLRDHILAHSTYGQEVLQAAQAQEAALQKVADDLNKLGNQITRENLVDMAIEYADNDDHLQALVGLVRPGLDYNFFQLLSERIEDDRSKKTRRKLRAMRDRLLEIVEALDQQQRAVVQQASALLSEIVNSENIQNAIQERLPAINNVFMAVLEANIEDAKEKNNDALLQRLEQVHTLISQMVMQSSPPEIRFIDELLRTEDVLEARLMLMERAPEFGPRLLQYMENIIEQLQGRNEDPLAQRLIELRDEAEKVIAEEE